MANEPKKRPGGRNEAVRRAVIAAVMDLIKSQGFEFNHTDVARLAGVHHTTVYRRWPTKSDLLRETMKEQYKRFDFEKSGNFVNDLREICQNLASYTAEPVQRIVFGYAVVSQSTDTADLLREFWFPIRREMEAVVQEAVDDGKLSPDTNVYLFVQLLIGPLILVPLFTRKKLPRGQVKKIIDRLLLAHGIADASR